MSVTTSELNKRNIQDMYALTSLQEGMLFLDELHQDSHLYFQQYTYAIDHEINVAVLEESLQRLTARYDVLRTVFLHKKIQKSRQVILAKRTPVLVFEDLSGWEEQQATAHVDEFRRQDRERGFDLAKDMMFRLALFQRQAAQFTMVLSFHHIIMDGWCSQFVLNELFHIYAALVKGHEVNLPATVPFHRYIQWLDRQDRAKSLAFWQHYLQGYDQSAEVPTYQEKPEEETRPLEEIFFEWDASETDEIVRFAKSQSITLNTFFQTVWGLVLQAYNQTSDVVFGSVVSGRPAEILGVERMVGPFVNTVPVRIQSRPGSTVSELFQTVQMGIMESKPHEYFPLYEIQAASLLKQYLVRHLFIFQNRPTGLATENDHGIRYRTEEIVTKTNYDFCLMVLPSERLTIKISYQPGCYDPTFVSSIGSHIKNVMAQIVQKPNIPVDSLALLNEAQQQALLFEQNCGPLRSVDASFVDLFEDQVRMHPDQIAVADDLMQLSYHELNRQADRLASALRSLGIAENDVVGLLLDRTTEWIVSMLGILKAGAAFLPIDPSFPPQRIDFQLQDSGAKLLITNAREQSEETHAWETFTPESLIRMGTDEPFTGHPRALSSLAYIIYTSGTTGTPKGVLIEEQSLVNYCQWLIGFAELTAEDRSAVLSSLSFDLSYSSVFPLLLAGGTVFLPPRWAVLNPADLTRYIVERHVTFLKMTPSLFHAWIEDAIEKPQGSLRMVVLGGEPIQLQDVRKFWLTHPHVSVINHYGPTEATVGTLAKKWTDATQPLSTTVGAPIDNARAYILDSQLKPVPPGVVGELYLSGKGIVRGYLNREDLTAKSFLPNPYLPGDRLYKTGDLATWSPHGEILLAGRNDDQVKIRGFRVEMREIESALRLLDEVSDAVVMQRDEPNGQQSLCAYLVLNRADTAVEQIRRSLEKTLPSYMIPDAYLVLDQIPLTENGKVDRKRLATLEPEAADAKQDRPPSNEMEELLTGLWSEILGVGAVGSQDHFFECGGHSLKAMMLVSRINRQLGVELSVRDVFDYPILSDLAVRLSFVARRQVDPIPFVEKQELYPMSPAQLRMYVLHQLEGEHSTYNMPLLFTIRAHVDGEKLEQALRQIIRRHEILRTSFHLRDGIPMQKVRDTFEFQVERCNATEEEAQRLVQAWVRPFDLTQAPLFRCLLVRVADQHFLLAMDFHHIVFDGASKLLLLRELEAFYQGQSLPAPKLQYKEYASWIQQRLQAGHYQKEEAYWLEKLSGELPVLNLTTDYARPDKKSALSAQKLIVELPEPLVPLVHKFVRAHNCTVFNLFFAVYSVLLSKYAGQSDILVGTAVAGRFHYDVEHALGNFINTVVLRSQPSAEKTFREFLSEVKETALQAYVHEAYPFERLVDNLNLQRDLSRNVLFDALFVMQNPEQATIAFEGTAFEKQVVERSATTCDLSLNVQDIGETYRMEWVYDTELFRESTVRGITEHWFQLLTTALLSPEQTLAELDMRTECERKSLALVNETRVPYPTEQTLTDLFAEQVKRTPDEVALVCDGQSLTYRELEERVNRLAVVLQRRGVAADRVVGLYMHRSLELMVGLLAILKAGGAYLPIDPKLPKERIEYMLADSEARWILADRASDGELSFAGTWMDVTSIDLPSVDLSEQGAFVHPDKTRADRMAYVTYTSGSTGQPKGVVIEHRAVVNFITGIRQAVPLRDCTTMLAVTTVSFDIHVLETVLALTQGMRVILATEREQNDPQALQRLIRTHEIDVLQMTPARMQLLLQGEAGDCLRHCKAILLGGEKMSDDLPAQLRARTSARLFNMYGPTEATVWAAVQEIVAGEEVFIGKPMANTEFYVVGPHGELQPDGIPGELWIAGDGLARGYYRKPELTDASFLSHAQIPGKRLYKTGDWVKRNRDGTLRFLGRIDDQVKIRGYRIELGEIEAKLREHPAIRAAAVLAETHAQGMQDLSAYLVAREPLTVADVKNDLRDRLPDYMIPDRFHLLAELPLTANGKIDRQALLKQSSPLESGASYVAPSSDVQQAVFRLWAEVLKTDRIGIHDSFFHVGGNSFLLIQLHALLERRYPGKIRLVELFAHHTIGEIARLIEQTEKRAEERIDKPARVQLPASWIGSNHAPAKRNTLQMKFKPALYAQLNRQLERTGMQRQALFVQAFQQMLASLNEQVDAPTNWMSADDETVFHVAETSWAVTNPAIRWSSEKANQWLYEKGVRAVFPLLFFGKGDFSRERFSPFELILYVEESTETFELGISCSGRLAKEQVTELFKRYVTWIGNYALGEGRGEP